MDTHWQKSRFLRRKALKGALGKAARVVASAAMLLSVFGPNPYSQVGTAYADPLEWTMINGFKDATNTDVFFPGAAGNLVDIDVCKDGTVFVVAQDGGAGSGFDVYRSGDAGRSFQQTVDEVAGDPVRIKCSPSYTKDSAVLVLTNTATGPVVRMSRNNGNSFATAANITADAATAGATDTGTATDLAVSGDFDATDEGTIAIGIVANDAEPLVYLNTWNGTAWADGAAWTTGIDIATYVEAVGDAARAVALSPNYGSDSALVAVFSLTGLGETHALITLGSASFPNPVADGTTEINNSANADTLSGAAGIFLPSDFDGDASNPRYYVAIDATTGTGNVYERKGTGWEGKNFDESVARDADSLAGRGTFAAPTLLVGWGGAGAAGFTNVSKGNPKSWDDDIDLIGNGRVRVVLDPNGNNAYGITTGVNGQVIRSTNDGSTWSETSLHNSNIAAATAFFTGVSGSAGVRLGAIMNGGGATRNGIFITQNPQSTNTFWYRGDRKSTALSDFENVIGLSISPDNPDVVWLIDDFDTVDQVGRSTNGGLFFGNTGADPGSEKPTYITAISSTEAFVVDTDAVVWRTTNSGGAWTKGADMGTAVHMIVPSPNYATDKTLLAGVTSTGTNLEVMVSKDNGLTWTQVGSSNENKAWKSNGTFMHVAFDAKNSNIVYAGPNNDSQDLYRYDMSASSPRWVEMKRPNTRATTSTRGLVVLPFGAGSVLYTVNDDGELASTFCPDLIDDTIDANKCQWRDVAPIAGIAAGSVLNNSLVVSKDADGDFTLYVLEADATPRLFTFTDTKESLAGPTLTSPVNNGTVPQNSGDDGQPFNLRWSDIPECDRYQVQVASNAQFQGPEINRTGAGTGPTTESSLVATGSLVNGDTYWWRVRCEFANGAAHDGGWSAAASFSVGVATRVSTPETQLPLDGSTATNVGPITFSFNLPSGSSQYQIQVLPLNMDGPGINLIIGDPAIVASGSFTAQPPVLGQGNYVLLPGATYTWRVRATSRTGAITETDSSWGPWSSIKTFKTPKPTSASVSLNAVGTGNATTDTTPTLSWKDSNVNSFYYEVQLSGDPNFNLDPKTATSFVYWNLVHGGETNPLNSWTVPDSAALAKGKYYWRVRPRVQATPLGPDEPGVAWTAAGSFTVQ
ncbi:MAG: hypothetical protein HY689_10125 [Chloroflexi bacterium]|nr:hypothetical protein [Chloroflexota bacterium]